MRSKRYPLALMPYWLLAIAMGTASQAASAARCDVDADRDIDRIDIVSIHHAVGSPASGGNDPRDGDGDGRILRNDELLCALRCTLPLCEVVSGDGHANRRPLARHDSARTAENTSVRINAIANDRDSDGRLVPKSIKIVAQPKHGRVRNHRNGIVTYTPASGFTGRDRFRYRIRDNDGARSRAARVRIIVERGNHPPLADAGSDTNTTTGLPVTLNGSGSSDPDGDALTFLWRFLSVPPPSTLSDALLANGNTAAPRFTPDVDGAYELALEASDGAMSAVDTVTITARAANVPPNAKAGPDASAVAGQAVNLDGRGSTDPDNGPAPLRFRWSFAAVPPGSLLSDINIAGASTALASFTPDFAGDYRISLDVNDGADAGRDEVLIAAALPNVAPNANAGADLVVQLGAGATLDGAASNDPDSGPTPLSFQWTFVNVPVESLLTEADLSSATTTAPSFTPDVEGFYLLRLDVSDGDLVDMDQVQVKANVAPVAVDDAFAVAEDVSLNRPAPGVLGNDSDGTSDPLTALLNTDVSNGTLALNPNGSFTYTPDTDFEGTDSFTYRANDGTVNSTNLATVTILVSAVDDPPVAVNDVATVNEDAPATAIAVLANDPDVDGGANTILAVQNPSVNGGTVLITNGGADLTYQPAPDYCNAPPATTPDTFTYTLSPGGSTATVGVTVNCVDDPPVAANDAVTINEDASATTIAVLANDLDPDGGLKAITAVQNPSAKGGTALITNGGADLTYQPAADYCNAPPGTTPDTFTYTLSPGGSTATISVTVSCVNDAPVIANLAGDTLAYTQGDPTTPIDQGGDAAAADVDSPDLDTGTLTVSLPVGLVPTEDQLGIRNQGTGVNQIGITGTDVTFNPGSGALIIGSFSGGGAGGGSLVVTFNASAGTAAVSALLRNITYLNSNTTSPTAANRTVRFVLGDGDGGASLGSDATIAIALNTPPVLTGGGASPTFTEDGAPIVLDGALTVADANDTNLESATVWITAAFQTGQDVLGFVDTPSITGSFDPLTGILSLSGSATVADYETALQSVTYQNTSQNPNPAARSVAFVANDGSANSNTITKTITVQSVNDAPSFTASNPPPILEDAGAQTVVSWATFNPGQPDESGQAVVGYTVSNISNGALFSVAPVVAANGNLTYTPAANGNGVSNFDVVVQDDGGTDNGGVDTAAPQTFTITVNAVNEVPAFTKGGNQTVNEDAGPQTVNGWATGISKGPADESGQTLAFQVSNDNNALFSAQPAVSSNGVLTFTPAANANGSATVTVTLQDDGGTDNGGDDTSDAQTFTITVNAVNDAPSLTASNPPTVLEDSGAQTVSNWATFNAGPANESSQTVLGYTVSNVGNAALFSTPPAVASNGTLSYTPAADAFGTSTFQVMVQDDGSTANGGVDTSAPQTFTITVTAVNDAPSFVSGGPVTVLEDAGSETVSPWATAISPGPNESGQTLSFLVSNDNNTLFSVQPAVESPSGTLTFTPAANGNGSATVMVTLQDSGGTLNGGVNSFGPLTFTITVSPVNDPPLVTPPAAYAAHAHIGINIPDGATDLFDGSTITDVDGPGATPFSLTATGPTASANGGSVTIAGNGSFSYNPPAGFTGANDTFTYQICDSGVPGSACTNATATVTVSGPRVWFVNNSLGSSGDGRLSSPFNTLAAADTAAIANGDRTFVFTGASTYTLGFGLLTNQRLIGQGVVDTNFDAALGITPPATSVARPAINGTRPIINGTVTLATGGTARGFNVNHTSATGVSGSGATGLTVNQVSVTTTTGTAVNLLNSGGTVSFTSVSANGAVNGILLNNATGSFAVTGSGTAGSGGTIQSTSGPGVLLSNAAGISLARMIIQNGGDDGIRGTTVTGFALLASTLQNNGNAIGSGNSGDNGLDFTDLLGTASISNSTITGSFHNNVIIRNSTGTLSGLTVTGANISNNVSTADGDGFLFEAGGTANMAVNVSGSTFSAHQGDHFQAAALNSGVLNVIFSGNTLSGGHAAPLGQGITINAATGVPGFLGSVSYDLVGNTINGAISNAIFVGLGTSAASSSMIGKIQNNTIGTSGIALSCSTQANGVYVDARGNGTFTSAVTSNVIRQCFDRGILSEAGDGDSVLNLTVTANTIDQQVAAGAREAIQTNYGITSTNVFGNVDSPAVCLQLGGAGALANVFSHGGGAPDDFRLRNRFEATVRLPGYGGSEDDTAAVVLYAQGRNTGSAGEPGSATASATAGAGYFNTVGGAACPLPP